MITFLPDHDFKTCARILDEKRLGKQRVECLQILKIIVQSTTYARPTDSTDDHFIGGMYVGPRTSPDRVAYLNHPATKMWREYRWMLIHYTYEMILEWKRRGCKDSCLEQLEDLMKVKMVRGGQARLKASQAKYPMSRIYPRWLGKERLHGSHRAVLMSKNPEFYGRYHWNDNYKDYWWPV